ncbi:glycine betaine/proline transport system permease protein [Rubrimonas cliftonensis]|uniref:Glycine betaine/proline transport system permease protein n=1 Tax=Rubrimonas cliftonensis TaxID=89524 RepID=A0A1H4G014_9RHOB|nr:glycine betaine/proline transport system permease protein [Rubrimonas cliftonensis]
MRPPEATPPPLADWLNAAFAVLRDDLGLMTLTRAAANGLETVIDALANVLYGKRRWPGLDPLPWSVVAVSVACLGHALGGWRLALLGGFTFVWIAGLGQWKLAMETLSVVLTAAPAAVALGLALGVAAWRRRSVEAALTPLLNVAQSLPHFAYMIPVVVFVGVGPKAGAVATIIFATPPMVRMTLLGLKAVPVEIVEAGRMAGATEWQLLRRVRLPTARDALLLGVNQVAMQSLAMVVLASFIGMPGLGQRLLQLLQALRIGQSIEIGVTIVLLAVLLDRLTRAWAGRRPAHAEATRGWAARNRAWLAWAALASLAWALASAFPIMAEVGRRDALSLADPLDAGVDRLVAALDPYTFALRGFLTGVVLTPMRDAFLAVPTSAALALMAGVGWRLGGARAGLTLLAYGAFIALSGWWDRSMITLYMVSFALVVAACVSLPLAVLAARGPRRANAALALCDTVQTFPSFIYLIPVIMLFGVTDVAAIAAVSILAAVPMLRYTVEGLRGAPPALLEAADMAGATRWRRLWAVEVPLAAPTMLVGLNQAVMFALFMVIIAAFIGTQDLGQEMQRALSASDVGKGLVLGLCVAAIGMSADVVIGGLRARATRGA